MAEVVAEVSAEAASRLTSARQRCPAGVLYPATFLQARREAERAAWEEQELERRRGRLSEWEAEERRRWELEETQRRTWQRAVWDAKEVGFRLSGWNKELPALCFP